MLSSEGVHGKGLFFFMYVNTMLAVSNVELRELLKLKASDWEAITFFFLLPCNAAVQYWEIITIQYCVSC